MRGMTKTAAPSSQSANPVAGPGRIAPAMARRVAGGATFASVAVAATLILAKLIAWGMSGSVAMMASLLDSLLDLAASLTVLFAVRFAAKPADTNHRFGHGKAEAMSSFIQGLLIIGAAVIIIVEAIRRLLDPRPIEAGGVAVAVMAGSMALTAALVAYQSWVIRRTGSIAIRGDRAHYLTDFLSNAAVALGVGLAAFAGLERADPILGFAVAAWLLWSAFSISKASLSQLLDEELSDAERAEIEALACNDPEVLGIHELRTRAAGPLLHIQLHMDLEPHQSLIKAHEVVVRAEKRILKRYPAADILIHADPRGHAEEHGHGFFDTDLVAPIIHEHHDDKPD